MDKTKDSSQLMASPTATQWNAAKACKIFSLTYIDQKKKSTGISQTTSTAHVKMPHCIFLEWQFNIGSFCLVRHQGTVGITPEECTRDKYWKARIVEIRSLKKKSNTSPVSGEKSTMR
jgi:hypothetical protein